MHATSVITSKGQVTLPKPVREFLHSRTVEFEIRDDEVVLHPVRSVGGTLKRYAKTCEPLQNVRDKVRQEVARDKA
ncbi:MAG: AbrB/MazE/SpoVT family DNA-binding domain-containing protein [Verrucomicrobiota bacterium]